MTAMATITDRIKGQLQVGVSILKTRVLGANNENIDFIMDSFYKLSPPQRSGVLAGVVAIIATFVGLAIYMFIFQARLLDSDLNNSFAALHELKSLKSAYEVENSKFNKLLDVVERKTRRIRMKPLLEEIATGQGIKLDGLTEKNVPLAADNPLSEKLQEVSVEMRLPKISIPRLLNFLVELEKKDKFLRVQNLQIRGRYGTRLYFDGQAKVRGYSVNR